MKAFFYNVSGLGHLRPTLAMAKVLLGKNWEVHCFNSIERKDLIESAGAKFRAYLKDVFHTRDFSSSYIFPLQLMPATLAILPRLLEVAKEELPDLIVYDCMCPWGKAVAEILGIPAICSVSTFALAPTIKNRMFIENEIQITPESQDALKKLQSEYQLCYEFSDVLGAYCDFNFVHTLADLNPALADLKTNRFHFGGSLLSASQAKQVNPGKKLWSEPAKKRVYMSMGTAVGPMIGKVKEFYEEFLVLAENRTDWEIIITMGGVAEPFPHSNRNAQLHKFVDQTLQLAFADSFVTHGGMNGINEGVYAGVPFLVSPFFGDQFLNAQQVDDLHLGKRLSQLSAAEVIAKLDLIHSDSSYLRKSMEIQKQMRDIESDHVLLNLVERALKE